MLPNTGMTFTPFDPLTAAELNDLVENIEALSDGTGIESNAITTAKIINGAVTPSKLDLDALAASTGTAQTTTSTSYTNLATVGPSVTVDIGANGLALVSFGCDANNSGGGYRIMSFDVSGATTLGASDVRAFGGAGTSNSVGGRTILLDGLNPGSNTFTAKYKVTSGTGTFQNRTIAVVPL